MYFFIMKKNTWLQILDDVNQFFIGKFGIKICFNVDLQLVNTILILLCVYLQA